jgi:hypothetical protein
MYHFLYRVETLLVTGDVLIMHDTDLDSITERVRHMLTMFSANSFRQDVTYIILQSWVNNTAIPHLALVWQGNGWNMTLSKRRLIEAYLHITEKD